MSRGYIPHKVVFFTRNEQCYTITGRRESVTCFPAFPVADQTVAKNGKTVDNAKWWASGAWGRPPRQAVPDIKGLEMDNTPKGGYRLVGAEQRGEGGRAWHVISPDGHRVDLREDVFLPLLLRKGLPADGIIPAEFQWCQNGSQLRLEEVGSKQHSEYKAPEVLEADRKTAQKARVAATKANAVPLKDLEVGGIYEFSMYGSPERRVYLGRVRCQKKLKTAWMQLRWNYGPEEVLDRLQAIMATGSKALRHAGRFELPPDVRQGISTWIRADGEQVSYERKVTVEWV